MFSHEQSVQIVQKQEACMTEKPDRRVLRTRALLRAALMQLVSEKGYDAVTIQDITDRANLGRTTFYLHYQTKDDLLLDHHADFTGSLDSTLQTRDELLSPTASPFQIRFLQALAEDKTHYLSIIRSKDSELILNGVRLQLFQTLVESLRAAFPNVEPRMPLDTLVQYIVAGQLGLMNWWVTSRTIYSAEQIATQMQQMQRALICTAYGL
jgi:AcrR family transcriptional regulator